MDSSLFDSLVLNTVTLSPKFLPNFTAMWPSPPSPLTQVTSQVGSYCAASWEYTQLCQHRIVVLPFPMGIHLVF
jgi:hypothetical protein